MAPPSGEDQKEPATPPPPPEKPAYIPLEEVYEEIRRSESAEAQRGELREEERRRREQETGT